MKRIARAITKGNLFWLRDKMGKLWENNNFAKSGGTPPTSEASCISHYLNFILSILILISIIYNFFFGSFFVIRFSYMFSKCVCLLSLCCILQNLLRAIQAINFLNHPVLSFPISVVVSRWGIIAQKGRF